MLTSRRTYFAPDRTHDILFAQILSCDLASTGPELAARARWLFQGTGFFEIASLAERQRLMQAALVPSL